MVRKLAIFVIGAIVVGAGGPVAAAPQPGVRFHGAQYDSPGPDDRTAKSLNAEWISVINEGPRAVSLAGWTVRDAQGAVYRFGKVSVAGKGGQVWLHTGKGADTGQRVYWNSGNYVWNNTGDTATLLEPSGKTVDTCAWEQKKDRTWTGC